MKKVAVRCWQVENHRLGVDTADHLFVTYPESNNGHKLITCTNCGELYAVTVVKEVYVGPPLVQKIKGLKCIECGCNLDKNFAYYPEMYFVDGELITYQRDEVLPDDEKSCVKDFYGIYES